MLARTVLIVAAGLVFGGCSTLTEYGSVKKESLRNEQGHVIGYKEMLRNARTGEVMAQMALFTPMRSETGEIVGYEEQARDGTVIRDLEGRTIGSRWSDLRSRNTNSKSRGITVVFRPADSKQVAQAGQPKIWELMASLSASELRRIQ